MKSSASILAGWMVRLAIGLAILGMVWRGVGGLEFESVLRSFDLSTAGLAVALYFASWFLAAYKWRLLLPRVPVALLARVVFASQFYGFLLPGQLGGEVSRAVLIARLRDDPDRCIASVFVDRLTGLVGLCIVAILGIQAGSTSAGLAFLAPFIAIALLAAAFLFALRFALVDQLIRRSVGSLTASKSPGVKKMGGFGQRAHAALHVFAHDGRLLALSVAMGIAFQVFCVAINYLLAGQLGIRISPFDLAWVVGVVSVAMLLPISIAGIGVRELTYVALLSLLDVAPDKALVLSLGVLALAASGALVGAVLEAGRLLTRKRRT